MHPGSAHAGWLSMMNNMTLLNRSGLAAIAAATAFLSTPSLAQDAAPVVTADPVPIVADTPLPADPAPTPAPEAVSDSLAPAAATTTTTTTTRTTRTTNPTRARTAPATRAPAATARAATATPAPPIAAPVQETAPAFDPAMVAPLPEPAATTPAPATGDSMIDNDLVPIAGAVGLGILALAGAGLAMRRRRREDDVEVEEAFQEPAMHRAEPLPVATAPIAAAPLGATSVADKPAFNWGNAPREPAPSTSWIEAARHGPTPDNPSHSLKKRLQRAAFFDQRERAVAAGTAVPVSPMAGLPRWSGRAAGSFG